MNSSKPEQFPYNERSAKAGREAEDRPDFASFGWLPPDPADSKRRSDIPDFSNFHEPLRGRGEGRTILLYKAIREVWLRDLDSQPQADEDCVGFAFAGCVDLLACCKAIDGTGFSTTFAERASPESVYALSRHLPFSNGNPPTTGSHGYWALAALTAGGAVPRNQVPAENFPTTDYFVRRSDEWGRTGLPAGLRGVAEQNHILAGAKVRSYEEARDAIANGYPVAVSGQFTFRPVRDEDGFSEQQDTIAHCMRFFGCIDLSKPGGKRRGLLCVDSSRRRYRGNPGIFDIPQNSFWMDADVCDAMIRQGEDSYALCGFRPAPEDQPFRPISDRLLKTVIAC